MIAIIGTLVGLLLPAVQTARESARRSSCQNKLKQVGLALHNYADAQKRLPPGCTTIASGGTSLNERDSNSGATWVVLVLPYLEQQSLYDRYNQSAWSRDATNNAITRNRLPELDCPSHEPATGRFTQAATGAANPTGFSGFAKGHYAVNVGSKLFNSYDDPLTRGPFSVLKLYGAKWSEFTDGTSRTILASEIINVQVGPDGDDRGAWGWSTGPTFSGGSPWLKVLTPNNPDPQAVDWSPYINNDATNRISNLRGGSDCCGGVAARSYHDTGCNTGHT